MISLLLSLYSLVTYHFLDRKQMRNRTLTSFCQFYKKTIKNTCRNKKSLHQDMVCFFKYIWIFEKYFNYEKIFHNISLRFLGNDNSEYLQNIIIERQNQIKFLRSMSIQIPSFEIIKWILRINSSYFSSVSSCSSSTKTKMKDIENILIFHFILRIQSLTVFSVQSK